MLKNRKQGATTTLPFMANSYKSLMIVSQKVKPKWYWMAHLYNQLRFHQDLLQAQVLPNLISAEYDCGVLATKPKAQTESMIHAD